MTRQTVGVIGGKGPEATETLFRRIIEHTPVTCEEDHLHVLIDNNPQIPKPALGITGDGEDPTPALVASATLLERAGADFIVIPCNSAHAYLEAIRAAVAIPVVSIITETISAVAREACTSVGLLASTGLLRTGLYQQAFGAAGVSVLLPGEDDQSAMLAGIMTFKDTGNTGPLREVLDRLCPSLVARGAGGLVLGCTELPVVLAGASLPVPAFDTIDILARAAVREATRED